MTECRNTDVRDALPELLHGKLSELDRASLMEHVQSCPACRVELDLLIEVRDSAPMAPNLDLLRIAAALPAAGTMVAHAPARERLTLFGVQPAVLRFAAVALVMVVAAFAVTEIVRDSSSPPVSRVAVTAPAPSVAETARTVAPAASPPDPGAAGTRAGGISLVASVQDLSDAQIEQLLAELDAVESLPSEDPEEFTLSMDVTEGDA